MAARGPCGLGRGIEDPALVHFLPIDGGSNHGNHLLKPGALDQFGALAAITAPRDCVAEMAASFTSRRQLLSDGLMAIPGLKLLPPEGAFYAFPDLSSFGLDSMTLCNRLLDEVGLAVVPGVAFGDDRCIRLSCAASEATILDGLERLQRLLASL